MYLLSKLSVSSTMAQLVRAEPVTDPAKQAALDVRIVSNSVLESCRAMRNIF